MVTYEDILQAWERWHETSNKRGWDALWMLTRDCIGAIIKKELRGTAPLDDDDLTDAIDGATCTIMERFQGAQFADIQWIASRFHLEKLTFLSSRKRAAQKKQQEYPLDDDTIAVDIMQKQCHPNDFF